MIRLRATIAAGVFAATTATVAVHADVVHRRGGIEPLEGRIERMHEWGVLVATAGGATHRVPWDRVRGLEFDGPDAPDPGLPAFLEVAEDLWRARTRLERGDATLAEPLFERHAARYLGRTHETALLVADGLLRCRLARGARAAAVIPALEALRLRRAGIAPTDGASSGAVDAATGLVPDLVPAFEPSRAIDRLRRDLLAYDAGGDEIVAAVAGLYRRGLDGEASDGASLPDHPGVTLLAHVVDALAAGDEAERARARLLDDLDVRPPWMRAWCRYAVGRSLLAESGRGRRQEGLLHLAAVPARLERAAPDVAVLALAAMIRSVEAADGPDAASGLRLELRRLDPTHPLARADRRPA